MQKFGLKRAFLNGRKLFLEKISENKKPRISPGLNADNNGRFRLPDLLDDNFLDLNFLSVVNGKEIESFRQVVIDGLLMC